MCDSLSLPFLYQVASVDVKNLRVVVKVKVHPEPELEYIINDQKLSVRYLPSYVVQERVGIPSVLLARITGNIQMERGSRDK